MTSARIRQGTKSKGIKRKGQSQTDLEMDCLPCQDMANVQYPQNFTPTKQVPVQQPVTIAPTVTPYQFQPNNTSVNYSVGQPFQMSACNFDFTLPQQNLTHYMAPSKPVVIMAQEQQMGYTNTTFTRRGGSSGDTVLQDISEKSNRENTSTDNVDVVDGWYAGNENIEKTVVNVSVLESKVSMGNNSETENRHCTMINDNKVICDEDVLDGVGMETVKQTEVTVVAKHKQLIRRMKYPSEGSDYRHSAGKLFCRVLYYMTCEKFHHLLG